MQKKLLNSSVLFLSLAILFSFSSRVNAATPTLSLTGTGDGDSVQVNVTGDPSMSVLLVYTKSGSGQQVASLGTTNGSGTLVTTISNSTYGIPSGSTVHIALGNINGPQSANVPWPAVAATISSTNMLSLSQTGLVLSPGQTATVTATNLGSSSLYLSNNSSPVIANFNINSSQITVLANSYGSTTGTFCLISNNSNCGSIYVIVQNGSAQPLTFSQSSVSLSSGQTIAIQISGGSGTYTVLNNSTQNNGTVTTGISGSTITLTTTSTTGSSSITVCSTNMTSCGIINVTIGNATTAAISFSQANPTLAVAQSLNVSVFGPTSSLLYVSSNSNPSMVQANLSGSTLTLLGITNGTSTISVCSSPSNCGTLNVTINSNTSTGTKLTLSQESVTMATGQTTNITISGGSMPYSFISNSPGLVQTTLNTNILTLNGLSTGSTLLNVCSAAGNCVTLSVTVTTPGAAQTTLLPGCASLGGYSQITGLLCTTAAAATPPPATTIPAYCTGTKYSMSTGLPCPLNTVINTPLVVTPPPATPAPEPTAPVVSATFKFTKDLKLNSKGTEVLELQKKLKTLGFYTGKLDGGFGPGTEKAVKAFQKAHKLSQVGGVGPQTRGLLNK